MSSVHGRLVIVLCFLLLALQSQGKGNRKEHIVLIHGVGHGAWCWYKVVELIQEEGHRAVALDMASAGTDKEISAEQVTSLEQYSKPLLDYLEQVDGTKEPITLVGHSMAGCVLTYAMEKYPDKISKAVFIASFTPLNNQSFLSSSYPEVFPRLGEKGLGIVHYDKEDTNKPTTFSFNLDLARTYLYNESPQEDIALAKSLLAEGPYGVSEEVMNVTQERYGKVRRFYIMTMKDMLFLPDHQEYTVSTNPPEAVFQIHGSDHSPFFSTPLQLSNILIHIATL